MVTLVERALEINKDKTLVDLAESQIKRANDNYTASAKEILRQAVVGVDQLVRGEMIDAERLIYLAFVADALEMILEGIKPEKALCLASGNRPKSESFQRDFVLFIQTGRALTKLKATNSIAGSPIRSAQQEVARKHGIKPATVKKAWEHFGAAAGYKEVGTAEAESE